ncbi:unnamed protein product [Prorocentrum cordatum]|uniref:DEAD-box RNA helicase Q domain-containing protein n=1 Tax=Prorocentrum cordatum TaxID=2364126 RepID=A0ABN9Y1N2_9DINO|nr:unnamed protein product [Polarella glacialis]
MTERQISDEPRARWDGAEASGGGGGGAWGSYQAALPRAAGGGGGEWSGGGGGGGGWGGGGAGKWNAWSGGGGGGGGDGGCGSTVDPWSRGEDAQGGGSGGDAWGNWGSASGSGGGWGGGGGASGSGGGGNGWGEWSGGNSGWGGGWGGGDPQDWAPNLKKIDWNGLSLVPIDKNFYEEHWSVQARTEAQAEEMRRSMDIEVLNDGGSVPKPVISFEEASMPDWLLSQVQKKGFKAPTPIQVQVWPVALQGRDLIGIAETGFSWHAFGGQLNKGLEEFFSSPALPVEIFAIKIFQYDTDDAVANNMAFLGGAIQIAQRISEPQLRDAIAHKLGAPRDGASMYARQPSAALSHALAKWRGAADGSRLHPAVKQVGEIGRLQAGSYRKAQARAPSRSRSPSRARPPSTPASGSAMGPGSIYKAYHAKAPTGTPLNARISRPHLSDPISIASSPGGAAAPRKNPPAEAGDKKKNNDKFEIFTVDYDRAPLIGQSGATTAEYKLAPGPDGMCTAKVHGDDKETEVPNAMCETRSKWKTKGTGGPLKRPAAAAKKPAGARGEKERAATEGDDGGGGQPEPDEVEVEELEALAVKKAKPAAAAAPERKCAAMRCERGGCSAARDNFGNERQACSIGKKSDRYSKGEKMKAAEELAKLLHENKSKLLAPISAAMGRALGREKVGAGGGGVNLAGDGEGDGADEQLGGLRTAPFGMRLRRPPSKCRHCGEMKYIGSGLCLSLKCQDWSRANRRHIATFGFYELPNKTQGAKKNNKGRKREEGVPGRWQHIEQREGEAADDSDSECEIISMQVPNMQRIRQAVKRELQGAASSSADGMATPPTPTAPRHEAAGAARPAPTTPDGSKGLENRARARGQAQAAQAAHDATAGQQRAAELESPGPAAQPTSAADKEIPGSTAEQEDQSKKRKPDMQSVGDGPSEKKQKDDTDKGDGGSKPDGGK